MDFPFIEFTFFCNKCGKQYILNEKNIPMILKCPLCEERVYLARQIKGFIYVVSNENMPGLFKVEMTTRNIEERIVELSGATGVPTPFILECLVLSHSPERDETEIHLQLAPHKLPNREFFRVKLNKLIRICQEVCGRNAYFLRQLSERILPGARIIKGKYYCPICGKKMKKLPARKGWNCPGCSIFADNQGRGYRQ